MQSLENSQTACQVAKLAPASILGSGPKVKEFGEGDLVAVARKILALNVTPETYRTRNTGSGDLSNPPGDIAS
jgi:hypothetical protein